MSSVILILSTIADSSDIAIIGLLLSKVRNFSLFKMPTTESATVIVVADLGLPSRRLSSPKNLLFLKYLA